MLKLYTDGATKGNPGPAGIGILVSGLPQQIQHHAALPAMSNHEAEFAAAIAGCKLLIESGLTTGTVAYYSDSKLVIQAIEKRYAKHYSALTAELLSLIDEFPLVLPNWIPDRQNRGAHHLAQQGLHQAETES